MPFDEIEALRSEMGMTQRRLRLVETARAAHSLKAENEALEQENDKLRAAFGAARRVLRYYGTHEESFVIAMRELDKECEAVKAADAE